MECVLSHTLWLRFSQQFIQWQSYSNSTALQGIAQKMLWKQLLIQVFLKYANIYFFAEDSLVNGFNHDEMNSSQHSLITAPSHPPLSCILCIPLEQMFTCSYSAFSRQTGRCEAWLWILLTIIHLRFVVINITHKLIQAILLFLLIFYKNKSGKLIFMDSYWKSQKKSLSNKLNVPYW